MMIKECTCDGHWVIYGIVESLYCTPETNITLYVNYAGTKIENLIEEFIALLKKWLSAFSYKG